MKKQTGQSSLSDDDNDDDNDAQSADNQASDDDEHPNDEEDEDDDDGRRKRKGKKKSKSAGSEQLAKKRGRKSKLNQVLDTDNILESDLHSPNSIESTDEPAKKRRKRVVEEDKMVSEQRHLLSRVFSECISFARTVTIDEDDGLV
jgi:hypothetical protein